MKTVILFGGGDGGGLLLTENGVRPIPPFDPGIRNSLKAASSLVNAIEGTRDTTIRGKMARQATSLCNLAVEQVEQVVGPLDPDRSLVFQDDDGGFFCGSTGKPPIPLPWPPPVIPSTRDLLAAGVIEIDMIEFLEAVRASKIPFTQAFEKPAAVAAKLGLSLSEKSARDLNILAPSRLEEIKDPTDREIIGFFHKVAKDGRFLQTWLSRPFEVSQTLKVKLSETALERLVSRGASGAFGSRGGDNAFADIGVCVAVVTGADVIIIAIVGLSSRPVEDIIRDRSGIAKI